VTWSRQWWRGVHPSKRPALSSEHSAAVPGTSARNSTSGKICAISSADGVLITVSSAAMMNTSKPGRS
jgi:hypothetical protein